MNVLQSVKMSEKFGNPVPGPSSTRARNEKKSVQTKLNSFFQPNKKIKLAPGADGNSQEETQSAPESLAHQASDDAWLLELRDPPPTS